MCADIAPPAVGNTRFDRNSRADCRRQHRLAVVRILCIEYVRARHRDNASLDSVRRKRIRRTIRQLHFRARCNQQNVGRTAAVLQYIGTARDISNLVSGALLVWQALASQHQAGRPGFVLDSLLPGDCGLNRVTGTPDAHVGHQAQ